MLPPLFFVHGMWCTGAVWADLAAHFRSRGHRVATPTLPLHDVAPDAPPPEGIGQLSIEDYVEWLVNEVRAFDPSPVIVGHSMGGMLAQRVAAITRPAGLVLLSTGPTASTASLTLDGARTLFRITARWGWWRNPTKLDPVRARWGVLNEVPSEQAEAVIRELVWDSGRVLSQMAMPWAFGRGGSAVDYERLDLPAMVLVGERDRITPAAISRATASRIAGARLVELPSVGHWLFHEPVRHRVAAEMEAFLATVGAGGG